MQRKLGLTSEETKPSTTQEDRIQYINFKLATMGLPIYRPEDKQADKSTYIIDLFDDIIKDYREKNRMLNIQNTGIHSRLNQFFQSYFKTFDHIPKVIDNVFNLDYYGLARELSLPPNRNTFSSEYLKSYRIKQGVLHNPKNDRRTTKGSFHIVEGPLGIPYDKKEVPKKTFLKLYEQAINPPKALLEIPFTSAQENMAHSFISLLVKPVVVPKVPGIVNEMSSEILFIAPGSLVANLDFVESVFGNAGDAGIHVNDAGLDVEGWTGHTGYVLLAPHLTQLRKIDLGLPHYSKATQRQRKDGMCYQDENECYNDGVAFKITCRDHTGVAVTIIADNYFGYSKKEIKTQISYASNLFGNVEEEHSGGTIAYPRMNVGEHYYGKRDSELTDYSFEEVKKRYAKLMEIKPENYGVDKKSNNIIYLPENVVIDLHATSITWEYLGEKHNLKLLPTYYYILPNGTKFQMEKHPSAPAWKLVLTEAEGTFCHKPCTVSGGGKSEISKSLDNAIIYGTYYVQEIEHDLNEVQKVLDYDYSYRWKAKPMPKSPCRSILSVERTLGSVIKLLTPSDDYTDEFNTYLDGIPSHIKAMVFMIKRFYKIEWGNNWKSHFTVDEINGKPGHELNYDNRKIRPSYLRVGFKEDQSWRIFKLRMDFMPTEKIQMEDDITSSVTVPASQLDYLCSRYDNYAYKFTQNCEYRFFQRPDEAIHKGYDKQAEQDLSSSNLFVTNYRALDKKDVRSIKEDVMGYISYTEPVVKHIESFLTGDDQYCIVSSEPRIVNGKPSKNPRYLEDRKDFTQPIKMYIADIGTRFARKIPLDMPVLNPVNAVLPGRRNNPASQEDGKRIRPLSVYSPIHYQELPELFMDYISSLTGKSPSTTGAGSEGALTKAPFNMLLPIFDLNSALLSYIISDYNAFSTPAGYIGSKVRVDHDISMLIPELWTRMKVEDRKPQKLFEEGSLERIEDFEHHGKIIPAGILGYRITRAFLSRYMGKIFDEPQTIFPEHILKPEQQNLEDFVDGVLNISEGHKKAASAYFEDDSISYAIPPLKALLHIMVNGEYKGMTLRSEAFRKLFDRKAVLESEWYDKRLKNKHLIDIALLEKKIENLNHFIDNPVNESIIDAFHYKERRDNATKKLEYVRSQAYYERLIGTLGAENIAVQ